MKGSGAKVKSKVMKQEILEKYNKPVPRYTSYPTVPFWDFSTIDSSIWISRMNQTLIDENGELAIYIHLPFCEKLCTFCACNKRITKNHKVESPYIEAVLREWQMYLAHMEVKPVIREIHLGGGTPTFFSPENLEYLISSILKGVHIAEDHEFSIEVHPNSANEKHFEVLGKLGFRRLSVGVQDFDPFVQEVINRYQDFDTTREVVNWARKYGFTDLNIDLVYGLPFQTLDSIKKSVTLVKKLNPQRIAYYSYAHVPWKSKVQRKFTKDDLPSAALKLQMYKSGSRALKAHGFESIGMDHFALKEDKMYKAYTSGNLNRNFMGYSTTNTKVIIGLGASSISDSWTAFVQNEKKVEDYQECIDRGAFPIINGHALTEEDLQVRKQILELMCQSTMKVDANHDDLAFQAHVKARLRTFEKDGLIKFKNGTISLEPSGQILVRHIASTFDKKLWGEMTNTEMFSRGI